mmetsp:Transcript_47766/g.112741  ORF Transcript_47766/g.112741 Transcript_47766/m.112741 type:complete len:200 (+) Transcript_47766:223-822(+)
MGFFACLSNTCSKLGNSTSACEIKSAVYLLWGVNFILNLIFVGCALKAYTEFEDLKAYTNGDSRRMLDVLLAITLIPTILSLLTGVHSMVFLLGKVGLRRGFHSGIIAAASFFVACFHIEFVLVSSKVFCFDGVGDENWRCPDVFMAAIVFSGLAIASGMIFCACFLLFLWREGGAEYGGVSRADAKPNPSAPADNNTV